MTLPLPLAPPPSGPLTVPALLAAAVASDGGRPRLTWYGADGERVELSARVLANWVAKTANLLVEELLDPPARGPAPTVLLDLPVHWRSVVWGLAAWSVGARVSDATDHTAGAGGEPPGAPAVVVTDSPGAAPPTDPAGAPLVVVTLAALAFAGTGVPPGALDYNAVVAGYGDDPPPGVTPLELDVAATEGTAPRVLLEVEDAGDAGDTDVTGALRAVVAALAADGSLVLRGPGAPDAAHLAAVERTT